MKFLVALLFVTVVFADAGLDSAVIEIEPEHESSDLIGEMKSAAPSHKHTHGLARTFKPCYEFDKQCFLESANDAFPKLLRGIPKFGLPSSDPLKVAKINGESSTLKYTFKDMTVTGYSRCKFTEFDFNHKTNTVSWVGLCPNTTYTGKYSLQGRLHHLPVEGKGTFNIHSRNYKIVLESQIKKMKGSNGKEYVTIKNFKGSAKPLAPIVFQLNNLFNGQKAKSDAFHKYANKNYKAVSDLVFEPVFNGFMKEIMKNLNKFVNKLPIENVVILSKGH